MSMDNKTENDALLMFLKGTDPSYRTGATQYIALVTDAGGGANVSEATPLTNECTYTGYARIPMTKATAWTDAGSSFNNTAQVAFGKRTDAGATQTATAFLVVDTGPTTGTAVNMCIIGDLTTDLDISQNIQPLFEAHTLTVTAD